MMLHHLGEHARAQRIEEALLEVYRKGEVRTADLSGTASTDQFADAICKAVG
jgi:isocitrate dehydrogenase (NAD+)